MQPTPLCGPKIGGILRVGFGSIAFSLYRCGAADGQALGGASSSSHSNTPYGTIRYMLTYSRSLSTVLLRLARAPR
jgi:hypothetical protein